MRVFIPGVPVPGGSKRAFQMHRSGCPAGRRLNKGPCICNARIVVADAAGERNKRWRYTIAQVVTEMMLTRGIGMFRGPLAVQMAFAIARPKGHFGKKGLRSSAPRHPARMPDCIKLARAAEDALNKILWYDDSQIVDTHVTKFYSPTTGLWLTVEPLDDVNEAAILRNSADLHSTGAVAQDTNHCIGQDERLDPGPSIPENLPF